MTSTVSKRMYRPTCQRDGEGAPGLDRLLGGRGDHLGQRRAGAGGRRVLDDADIRVGAARFVKPSFNQQKQNVIRSADACGDLAKRELSKIPHYEGRHKH